MRNTYIAVIKSSAVRDAQYALTNDPEPGRESDWADMADAEIYLDVYKNMTADEAIEKATKYAMTAPENIRLIPVS